jgi:hypothetical protein
MGLALSALAWSAPRIQPIEYSGLLSTPHLPGVDPIAVLKTAKKAADSGLPNMALELAFDTYDAS